jgi:hypothetical protein
MWQTWFEFCTTHNIEPYYEWVPREDNTRADKLSKRVPIAWSLTPAALRTLESTFPPNPLTPVVLPDLNQYANVLRTAREDKATLILVHPVWPAMAWWHYISSACTRHVDLPLANTTLVAVRGDSKRHGPKRWKMRASLLQF